MQRANLTLYISIIQPDGSERQYSGSSLPLVIGTGEHAHLRLLSGPAVAGIIAQEQGHLFIQPSDDRQEPLFHNNISLSSSSWLKSGDLIQYGNTHVACTISGDKITFTLSAVNQKRDTGSREPAKPDSFPGRPGNGYDIPVTIADNSGISKIKKVTAAALGSLLLLLAISIVFILSAEPLELAVTPEPDSISLSGFPPAVKFGSNYLCLPGTYIMQAEKKGFRSLKVPLTVRKGDRNRFEGELEKLPGKLILNIDPAENVNIFANGTLVGKTPPGELELAAGAYSLRLEKDNYLPFLTEIVINGPNQPTSVKAILQPDSADISIASDPGGASVFIDGEAAGQTPLTARLASGKKEILITGDLFLKQQKTIDVEAGVSQNLFFELQLKPGQLVITSVPSQAAILIDDRYQGTTPTSISLSPDTTHEITLFSDGHKPFTRTIRLAPGEQKEIAGQLTREQGTVYLITHPPDASVLIDGAPLASSQGRHVLPVKELTLEVSAEGYKSVTRTLHPKAGYSQQISIDLSPLTQNVVAGYQPKPQDGPEVTAAGQKLLLVRPSTFTMGAPRREPGRRANERERKTVMRRPFYLSDKPVTNKEYRLFKAEHSSGTYKNLTLDGDNQPVVNISWEDSAAYLNWLSEKDNLQPFYVASGNTFTAVSPPTNGYRLPSEAEWAFSARILGQPSKTRFPWGNTFPPARNSGNFADESARGVTVQIIQGFNDGFPVSSPVGSFPPNRGGFFDMGGNISEWCHDYYAADTSTLEQEPDSLGPASGLHRVVRGSSWRDASVRELRLSYRAYQKNPQDTIGFRIARYQ